MPYLTNVRPESGCSEEWTIIGIATIRCISEQLWVITCNKNCCEAFIQIRWVLFPIAMNRSSGYNPSKIALQFRRNCGVLKSRARWEGSVSRMCVDPGCRDPVFWPAELSEWTCICRTVWLVGLAYRACVTDARNPDVNSSAVNLREYRTFDVIKSIAIECVRAQQGVRRSKYKSWCRDGFTEEYNHRAATVRLRAQIGWRSRV